MDEEAGAIHEGIKKDYAMYNKKLNTMKKTRQMMMGMVTYEDFEDWDSGFINSRELQLKVLDTEKVPIF